MVVVDESATGEVSRVSGEFSTDPNVPFARLQRVDGAHVVQSATRHEVTARSVRAGHHPRGPQRYRVDLSANYSHLWMIYSSLAPSSTRFLKTLMFDV